MVNAIGNETVDNYTFYIKQKNINLFRLQDFNIDEEKLADSELPFILMEL